ncbi:MAG TPA: MerR family transcriptional regulator [Puia sp.]|uniref:MerR family transcriptional regulator n=1 Tax=Puia sp. TaxID=2045100 RepID=UPI002BDFA1A0|nr:MerR family transcriptional regulator [Puia sp.]HVU94867.1 MerR family transcriptional regulator [Puia sp.]
MALFSISQLGRFSGIKPHTIRAWETRYKALSPSRSLGNTRYYDSNQMKRLLTMVSLVNAGYRASEVAPLPDDRLEVLLESAYRSNTQTERYFISQLIAAGMSYDITRFENIYDHCVGRYRLKNAYQFVLLPMLERVGMLWKCDKASPPQEHFVSNIIRQKLCAAVEAIPSARPNSEKWLLFLPENEFHELGLLVAHNLIRLSGKEVIYLGANVPWSALPTAVRDIRPDNILFFSVYQELPKHALPHLQQFEESFSGKNIYAAGSGTSILRSFTGKKVQFLKTVEALTAVLASGT